MNEQEEPGAGSATPAVEAPSAEPTNQGAPSGDTRPERPASPASPSGQVPPGYVPLSALLQERDQGREYKQKAQSLEARIAEQERKAREAAVKPPDYLADDPETIAAYWNKQIGDQVGSVRSHFEGVLHAQKMEDSHEALMDKIGEAHEFWDWVEAQPEQAHDHWQTLRRPYQAAFAAFEQAKRATRVKPIIERIGDEDPEAWIEAEIQRRMTERAGGAGAETPTTEQPGRDLNRDPKTGQFAPSPQQKRSAPSLASVNGAPSPSGSGAVSGYDALFAKG